LRPVVLEAVNVQHNLMPAFPPRSGASPSLQRRSRRES
jgi:hypothetical protein